MRKKAWGYGFDVSDNDDVIKYASCPICKKWVGNPFWMLQLFVIKEPSKIFKEFRNVFYYSIKNWLRRNK